MGKRRAPRFRDWVGERWLAKHPGPYKVGDRVRFCFGVEDVEGTIIEDRGNLGVGGKRVYGIKFRIGGPPSQYIELDTDHIQLVTPDQPTDANGESK